MHGCVHDNDYTRVHTQRTVTSRMAKLARNGRILRLMCRFFAIKASFLLTRGIISSRVYKKMFPLGGRLRGNFVERDLIGQWLQSNVCVRLTLTGEAPWPVATDCI